MFGILIQPLQMLLFSLLVLLYLILPLLFLLLLDAQNPVHVLFRGLEVQHFLAVLAVLFVLLLLLFQKRVILFGKLCHLGNRFPAQGVKCFPRRLMLCDFLCVGG